MAQGKGWRGFCHAFRRPSLERRSWIGPGTGGGDRRAHGNKTAAHPVRLHGQPPAQPDSRSCVLLPARPKGIVSRARPRICTRAGCSRHRGRRCHIRDGATSSEHAAEALSAIDRRAPGYRSWHSGRLRARPAGTCRASNRARISAPPAMKTPMLPGAPLRDRGDDPGRHTREERPHHAAPEVL